MKMKNLFNVLRIVVLAVFMLAGCDHGTGSNPAAVVKEDVKPDFVLSKEEIVFETPDLKETLTALYNEQSASVNWEVSDGYVASIDANGTITALAGGTAVIKATLKTDASKTATCTVTVAEPERSVTADPFDLKTISESIDIICCGDSIMRDYGASDSDQYGLGQALASVFDSSKAKVITSISNGGRSTRYFWNETSRWPTVVQMLEANRQANKKTVVIFSFGHNDQRSLAGSDSNVGEFGASWTFASKNPNGTVAGTHYDYIERYIVETRKLGAVPVLLSPFVRADFSGNTVSAYGKHDWSNKTATGDTVPRGNYPAAMKSAAQKHNAIFVDMTELSAAKVAEYNSAGKLKYFYVDSDNTHERTLGGLELAKLVSDDLKTKGCLVSYIKETQSRIMVNKASLAFGRLLQNAEKILSFKISNFQTKAGVVTITVPSGFGVALSQNGTYASSLQLTTNSDFIGTEVFVKFSPAEIISYNGNMEIVHSSVAPDFGNTPQGSFDGSKLLVALTGAGKNKSAAGTEASINWPMINESAYSASPVVTGSEDLYPAEAKLVGLEPSTKCSTTGYARVIIAGGKWPVNDTGAKLSDVYIEYAIPANGVNMTVNKISFDAGSGGGSYMCWSAYYSTDPEFANPDPITEIEGYKETKNSVKHVSIGGDKGTDAALGVPVEDGQTFYLRIYPSHKDTAEKTGKTFIIHDVKIEGLVD
jgi:lysophospholipase L1-like esterase